MKRMNLRDVPDDLYTALPEAARVTRLRDYLNEYQPADASDVSLEDAVSAVREARGAS